MSKNKKSKKNSYSPAEIWTQKQYEQYLENQYDMKFIAGFTENGIPYGTFNDEDKEDDKDLL